MGTRQVHQMLACLSFGDAVSNAALRIQQVLRKGGYQSEIFAETMHPAMRGRGYPLWEYERVSSSENVLIFHFSIGGAVSNFAYRLPDRLMLIYHNITPARWFAEYHPRVARLSYRGRHELAAFRSQTALGLGVSEFNRCELEAMGFHPTAVVPLLLASDELERPPNEVIQRMFDDDKTNFLFVGRVMPNKRFEDLIRVFHFYQRYIESKCRLLVVGDYLGFERYFDALMRLVRALGVRDVVFTGHVASDDLVAYFELADLFLCLSEHEGFCAPLVEAFRFGVPVMAFDAGAVPETLRGGGILIREKKVEEIAEMAQLLVHDWELRERVIAGQDRVLGETDGRGEKLLLEYVEQVKSGMVEVNGG